MSSGKNPKRVLFLVTELQKPVGGLYRFTIEFLQGWRKLLEEKRTRLEPFVLSLRDPFQPLDDLTPSPLFAELKNASAGKLSVFEAIRGGEKVFFLESSLNEAERISLHKELWEKYRIRSGKAASWDYYQSLNSFWKHAADVAQFASTKFDIAFIDAQDWLAFPAGFLCKERLDAPLLCRFHSGEIGRSMGKPDIEAPPLSIEVAALQEADFVQSVSVTEAKFEVYNLLPLKREIEKELAPNRKPEWLEAQSWKNENYEEFLLLEPPQDDLVLLGGNVGGIPNGIILDSWKKVERETIEEGRALLKEMLPNKKKYILFVGRTETRKGIGALIEALALLNDPEIGLVLFSSFTEESYRNYSRKITELGLDEQVSIHNGWIDERNKKALFCSCDVMALPSLYEPFGIVTLEGLAADLAAEKNVMNGPIVVVGDTGGMHEVIRNGVNGFKAPMEQGLFDLKPELLARVLRIALKGGELKRRISEGGARRVQSKFFRWDYIVETVLCAYDKARENHEFVKRLCESSQRGETEEMVSAEELFGGNAGKVWLALKDSKPLGPRELSKKTGLKEHEVYGGLGWLGRESKLNVIEKASGHKFSLR